MQSVDRTLPPGYGLVEAGPYLWLLRRPDGWPIRSFVSLGVAREQADRVAWRDHRRSTLRVIAGDVGR